MKLAIISDLHADLHALHDALAQIERLGCDVIVCAGDIMDGEPFPEETIALLIERRIPTIRGNHDRWALREDRDTSGWDLSREALTFLRALPLSWSATLGGVRVAMHHARPVENDMDGLYADQLDDDRAESLIDDAAADVLLVGHTHVPFVYRTSSGRLLANPGTVWRGGADNALVFDRSTGAFGLKPTIRGTFGVLHVEERRFVVHSATDGSVVLESAQQGAPRT